MTVDLRFRDAARRFVPKWLSDRPDANVAYRFIWALASVLDAGAEFALQGQQAAWPGVGTPTALPLIGRSRGLIRGEADTDEEFAAKLDAWLDTWRGAGSQEILARAIHEYLGNHPRVRVVNRAGHWVTIAADGTLTTAQATWNWDSVSHPERAGNWSELWIVVYPTEWAVRPGTLGDMPAHDDGHGWGHLCTHQEVDAVKGLLAQWKSAHSLVRAVIWTSDATLFDPAVPLSCPDGQWGNWGTVGNGSRIASHRNLTSCRYWEPWG